MSKWIWLIIGVLVIFGLFIRAYKVTEAPPSLYWEEVALGYDAFSILETGKDHHGNAWPIIAFESFGDWKPSLYFYYLVPFVKVFGLSELAVRLSAVFLGLVVILGIIVLAKQLKISTLSTAVVAVLSPWAIHFSRGGWEAHLATTLILWGIITWIYAVKRQKIWSWLASGLFFGLAPYAYHSARLVVPLLVIGLLILTVHTLKKPGQSILKVKKAKTFLLPLSAALLAALMMMPLLVSLFNPNTAAITKRFSETGLGSDLSIIEQSNQLKEISGNTLLSRALYHRHVLFTRAVIENFLLYSSPDFWIIKGDPNLRHGSGFTGHMYHIELVFLIVGLLMIVKYKDVWQWILVFWLLIAILPATLAIPNPHALRILIGMPSVILIIGLGLQTVFGYFHRVIELWVEKFAKPQTIFRSHRKTLALAITVSIFAVIYLAEFMSFYRYYLKVYPVQAASQWQYGYKQMVEEIAPYIGSENTIYVDRATGRPAMYVWFYTKADPRHVQLANDIVEQDQGEYLAFQNIVFARQVDLGLLRTGDVAAISIDLSETTSFPGFSETIIKDQAGRPVWFVLRKE